MSDFADDQEEDVVDQEADGGDIRERVAERVEERRDESKGLFEADDSGDEVVDAGEEDAVEDDGE